MSKQRSRSMALSDSFIKRYNSSARRRARSTDSSAESTTQFGDSNVRTNAVKLRSASYQTTIRLSLSKSTNFLWRNEVNFIGGPPAGKAAVGSRFLSHQKERSWNDLPAARLQNRVHQRFQLRTARNRHGEVIFAEDPGSVSRLDVAVSTPSGLENLPDPVRGRIVVVHILRVSGRAGAVVAGQALYRRPVRQEPSFEIVLGRVWVKPRFRPHPVPHFRFGIRGVNKHRRMGSGVHVRESDHLIRSLRSRKQVGHQSPKLVTGRNAAVVG